ncbi:WD repeat-containing protein 75 [Epargyreus clarus]|uniref:WD repeat-containing protein 75 n=1 Tax=Epargyreus clarus TaxID=520877 RepID=UPI003C2F29CD
MGVKRQTDTNLTKYVLNRKAGRSIIERRPVFSPDGESLAIIVENIVRVYNIQTGDCVRTLESETPINELVAIEFPENEDYNLYGCSDCGCVITWTWEKGAVLREAKLQLPKDAKVLTFNLIDSNECFITAMEPANTQLYTASYSVRSGALNYEFATTRPLYYDIVRVSMGWCNGDRFAAVTNGTKVLFIQNMYKPHMRTQIVNHNKFRILSVSAHHRESAIAITDTIGRVTIITGNLYDYRTVAREVLHWHFLPPFAICFSVIGNYLFSGGMEKVLVKWTLGHLANKANEKAYIPRLPGMIRYITVNSSNIAITLSNNSVVIASAQMRVVSTILECGGISAASRARSWLVYHRPLDALLLPGRTGHLQLYSTATDKVLYNIDITEMNNLPSERRNLLPLETEVACAAVSADGSWLVTSEYRNDGINYPEEKLKFWSAQSKNTTPFKLNTCVNLSHGGCNVVSLALSNKGEFCVSAGLDQKFRIWRREKSSQTHRKKIIWSCLTACYYSSGIAHFLANPVLNNFKTGDVSLGKTEDSPYLKDVDEEDIIKKVFNLHKERTGFSRVEDDVFRKHDGDMGGVAISHDGSLIAAWFGSKLTLWDTHLCNLRTTLSHPALRPKGKHVMFGNNDAAHYLVCTTENCVAVWSLLSLTIKWLVQLKPMWLAGDPFSNKMAVITDNNDLFVFRPQSSEPILTRKNIVDPQTGVFTQCAFGAPIGDKVRLYIVRNDAEIFCLEPENSKAHGLEVMSRRNLPLSNFSALLAEQHLSEVQPAVPVSGQALNMESLGNTAISQFLSGAPHMVPPVAMMCTSFLQHLSGYEEIEEPQDEEDKEMEVDPQSSDDEDSSTPTLIGKHTPKATELWTPNYDNVKEKRLKKILNKPLLDLHTTGTLFGL